MGSGKSRIKSNDDLKKVDGSVVSFTDINNKKVKFDAGKSWDELIKGANESNNYYNCSALELLQPNGFYAGGSGRKKYFSEETLYIANQIVNSYNILKEATGGNDLFMYSSTDADENIRKMRSKINIGVDNELTLNQYFSYMNDGGSTIARNKGGEITLYTHLRRKSTGKIVDLRDPEQAEQRHMELYKEGWSSAPGFLGTILHEYGHSAEKNIAKHYKGAYDKFLKETNEGVNQFVSDYPRSYSDKTIQRQENFAEAFAAYVMNVPFRKGTEEYKKAFSILMKEVGIKQVKTEYSSIKAKTSATKSTIEGDLKSKKVSTPPKIKKATTSNPRVIPRASNAPESIKTMAKNVGFNLNKVEKMFKGVSALEIKSTIDSYFRGDSKKYTKEQKEVLESLDLRSSELTELIKYLTGLK